MASAPADLQDGDVYYNNVLGKLRQKVGGLEGDLGAGVSPPTLSGSSTVGTNPTLLAFDSLTNSVWVTRFTNNSVTKINAVTGAVITTVSTGTTSYGVAFDPITNSVWVTNRDNNTVTKINASTNAVIANYSTVTQPVCAVFDPLNDCIWVGGLTGSINKIRVQDGAILATIAVSSAVYSLAFDSLTNSIWTANYLANTVSKVDSITGTVTGTYAVGTNPFGITFDPYTNSVWVGNAGATTVTKLNAQDGSVLGTFTIGTPTGDLCFDSSTNSVWAAVGATAVQINPLTGAIVTTISGLNGALGICYDFFTNSVWVANASTTTVSKIATNVSAGLATSDLANIDETGVAVVKDIVATYGNPGDVTNVEARLQSRFQVSSWRALTTNVFSVDKYAKLASYTGQLEQNDLILGSGQNLLSTQNLDSEFLAAGVLPLGAEVQLFYDLAAVDANPTVQLSRDGGATLQTVTVSKNSGDDSWRGSIIFSDTEANVTVDTYAVANADSTSEFNITSQQSQAQSFILSATQVLKQVTVYLNKIGSPSGNFTISIVKDVSGNPSTSRGDYYSTSAPQSVTALSAGNNAVAINLPQSLVLPAGTYWLVIETDSTYKASFSAGVNSIRARIDASAPTAPGQFSAYNGSAWAVNATVDNVYLISGFALDLRLKITSGTAGSKLKGYGVFYDKGVDQTVGRSNRYEIAFDGATNPNTFDLTNSGFIPDDKLLIVIWANTGQIFVHPVFDVSGYSVQFAANQFSSTGQQRLIFWQPLGSSFDNSEKNAALLAENRLGSQTPGLDRSVAGQGIILRASNGTLVEASILWNGSSYVWQFATLPG